MNFTHQFDRLAACLAQLAGLLPRATVAWWPVAEALLTRMTEPRCVRLRRTTPRLERWAYGPKMNWP
jgi:hypothetical protein